MEVAVKTILPSGADAAAAAAELRHEANILARVSVILVLTPGTTHKDLAWVSATLIRTLDTKQTLKRGYSVCS